MGKPNKPKKVLRQILAKPAVRLEDRTESFTIHEAELVLFISVSYHGLKATKVFVVKYSNDPYKIPKGIFLKLDAVVKYKVDNFNPSDSAEGALRERVIAFHAVLRRFYEEELAPKQKC
jgi:hypothetical protein